MLRSRSSVFHPGLLVPDFLNLYILRQISLQMPSQRDRRPWIQKTSHVVLFPQRYAIVAQNIVRSDQMDCSIEAI